MNYNSGAHTLGKQRLARIVSVEREAARNPQRGRSRAERLLDEHLNADKTVESSNPYAKIPRPTRTHPKTAPYVPVNDTSSPADTLIILVRRLDLEDKLGRTLELFLRFFNSTDGLIMLKAWRQACKHGAKAEGDDNLSWLVFYSVWHLAQCPALRQNGDARLKLIELMEEHLILPDENVKDLAYWRPIKSLNLDTADGLTSSEPTGRKLHFAIASTLELHQEFPAIFDGVVRVSRVPLLVFHHLFADDSLQFHKSVDFVRDAIKSFPTGMGKWLDGHPSLLIRSHITAHNEGTNAVTWEVPSVDELRGWLYEWLMACIEQVYECSGRTKWGLSGARGLLEYLYMNEQSKFRIADWKKIEKWQRNITTAKGNKEKQLPDIQLPGEADRPVTDTRVEEVVATDGSASWADRHIYNP